MLFKDQIEKRIELEQAAFEEAVNDIALASGCNTKHKLPKITDNTVIKQLLSALKINDYTLEENDFITVEEQLEKIFISNGIMQRHIRLNNKWWRETIGPILGEDKEGHPVALIQSRWSRNYTYINKKGKKIAINKKLMKEEFNLDASCFYPTLPRRAITYKDLFVFIASIIRFPQVILLISACLVMTLFGMFTPFINKQIFYTVIPNGIMQDLYPIAGLLVGAAVGAILFGITRDFILFQIKDSVNIYVQNAFMARTFSLPANFFRECPSGEISSHITGIYQLCVLLNNTIFSSLLTVIFSLLYVWQITLYAGALLVPSLLIFFCQTLLMTLNLWFSNSNRHAYLLSTSKLSGFTYKLFTGIQKIKLTGSEKRGFTRWLHLYKTCVSFRYKPMLFLALAPALIGAFSLGGTAFLYYCTIKNDIIVSDYIAFISAYGMVNGVIISLIETIPALAEARQHLKMVEPIMNAVPEVSNDKLQISFLTGAIEVSNLSFRYSLDNPWIFKNLNFKINPGEYVGIVGKSGCGKSTLLRILLGFDTPQIGAIYYGDYDLSKIDKSSLRRCIGSCLQGGSLFPGSILSNITVTAPRSSIDDAWNAARLAGIDKEIEEMPMGMQTLISEGGGGISGGQKQRILIARALINRPNLILFDEATSALDNISQKLVSNNLTTLKCTRIIIAHRLSTIVNCGRIIVLDNGGIAEEGSVEELMNKKGLFYEMSLRQQ
ncbi:MAG: ATP-binding cassette domain-containing protein [Bacteroidales bacterium]